MLFRSPNRAVSELEAASQAEPKNAAILSDLSAAYFVRAERLGQESDYHAAFAAASRALQTNPQLPEARFNLALTMPRGLVGTSAALTGSDRIKQIREAWEAYLALDSSSRWAAEARRHLAELTQGP